MKAIVVMEMQEHCIECPARRPSDDGCIFQSDDENFEADTWEALKKGCPMMPMPERKQNACSHGFAGGWNACLDAIGGEG